MAVEINNLVSWPVRRAVFKISAAEIVALGASTTGTITLPFVLPPKSRVMAAAAFNAGTAAATLTTLTVQIGDAGDADRYFAENTVFLANAGRSMIARDLAGASNTAETTVTCLITGNANLSGLTGLTDGVVVYIYYIEA